MKSVRHPRPVTATISDIGAKDAEKHLASMEGGRRLAEEALKESEERYRLLLDGIQDYAILAMDPRGQIVSWNAGAERIKGYRADQIIGRNFSCFFPPEDIERGRPEEVLRLTAANGRHEEQGMRVRKDGSRFLAHVIFTALRDPAGNLRGFSEFSHDLSKSNEAEAKYRGLLEAAPDAMVVVNQGGEIVLLNLQAERQFGYRRDELLGQKVTNIIPEGFAERVLADGLRSAEDALAQQIGTGIELIGRRKDGSEFPIELMLSPLKSAEGILVTTAIRDITERKDAEEALLASEERLRTTIDAAEMGTWFWNLGTDEVSCSEQFRTIFGLTSDDKLNYQACVARAHPDDRELIDQAVKEALELGVPLYVEHRVIWPDSTVHWITAKGRAHRDAQGVAVYMQGIVVDVTERKAAQEAKKHREALERRATELTRSNNDLQQFAYIAAHDLQEPLRMVASYTQLLSKRYTGKLDSDADEFIAYAVDGAHRMQLLIEDLLTYCRVGTTGKPPQEVSSTVALEQALLNLHGAIEESSGVVTHDPLPTVLVDGAQLTQLFQNVVANALKYHSAEPPRVHVSAKKNPAGEWIFSMRDNGIGIDPQYFEKVFVMFQRLHGREEFSGTGIGLTLCKKIAERHGGRMWVESEPGKGSTFYVALPGRETI
jgi:PAS domain S-box-containing protein